MCNIGELETAVRENIAVGAHLRERNRAAALAADFRADLALAAERATLNGGIGSNLAGKKTHCPANKSRGGPVWCGEKVMLQTGRASVNHRHQLTGPLFYSSTMSRMRSSFAGPSVQ